jgi:hypothetical protein
MAFNFQKTSFGAVPLLPIRLKGIMSIMISGCSSICREHFLIEPSGDACDHYHRYPQDIKILAELGLNAYRFSIEWARVQPEENWFSRAEIEHYRRMLGVCHEHGLKPVVTFHHFSHRRAGFLQRVVGKIWLLPIILPATVNAWRTTWAI